MSDIPVYRFRFGEAAAFPFEIVRIEDHPILSQPAQRPRRDRFYALFWITGGTGEYLIDFQKYAFTPHTLVLIAPGQVHSWHSRRRVEGYAVPFQAELFHSLDGSDFLDQLDLFDITGNAFLVTLAGEAAPAMSRLFEQLDAEYASRQFGRTEKIIALLKIILIEAQRRLRPVVGEAAGSAGQHLVRQYLALLKNATRATLRLEGLAAQLGVSPGHLTDTLKALTGVPAGVWLRQRLLLEAKRLLVHTDLTISQVGEKLDFKDTTYFNRFFKRETGQTPGTFRQEFRRPT